jgi:NAD(P)-dependent dehydrogenase (short-subunit alcohol dehydrogenase family)
MLKGKTALITGGGRGIGRATAILMARRGAVTAVCSRTKKEADETVRIITSEGGRAFSFKCDISSEKQVAKLFGEIRSKFGGLDILVNNAGIFHSSLVGKTTLKKFNRVISVNVNGVFLCCREAFAQMKKKGGGSIVNLSSLSGVRGAKKFPGFSAYCASKFGVIGLTESLAEEGKEFGIRVNAVCPGAVDTAMLNSAFPNAHPRLAPEQVAEAIVYLTEPSASGVNGVSLELQSDLLAQK